MAASGGAQQRHGPASRRKARAWHRDVQQRQSIDNHGKAMASQRRAEQARQWSSSEAICPAKQRQSGAVLSNSMAKKSADLICNGKVVHCNDSLRQGFASDALAWKREEMP